MAEEQFTSRRARREAERQAAEQAFEARDVPEQPQEAPNSRADLLAPRPPKKPGTAPAPRQAAAEPGPADSAVSKGEAAASRIDPNPSPRTSHERGALASDHPQASRPPVHAEDRLDPQRAPLPHFQSRAEKKRYLREHGLSLTGDLSTGALPVVADETELAERQAASEGRLTGPLPEISDPADESAGTADDTAADMTAAGTGASDSPVEDRPEDDSVAEHESYDAAGFGGDRDEVAARDFETPVTAASAPRPTTSENEPYDALSMPFSALDGDSAEDSTPTPVTEAPDLGTPAHEADEDTLTTGSRGAESFASATEDRASADSIVSTTDDAADTDDTTVENDKAGADDTAVAGNTANTAGERGSVNDGLGETTETDEPEPASRSRRMPIVQPPSTSGVRVVTAASAQIPTVNEPTSSQTVGTGSASNGSAPAYTTPATEAETPEYEPGSDDAARALAANPETRPMDAVPEAWSLPNTDYEEEETENPPGTRVRATSVTGHDGQILMGEEPSKTPYIVLGIAAFFALALIIVAFILF